MMKSTTEELSINEIHEKTLDIMDYVHDFCEKNDINYVLGYGTLIGAVRHKGFIPWDDDFDVHMLRKDFDKFCKLFMESEHSYYKMICRSNDKTYTYAIPRVYDSRFDYVSSEKGHERIKYPNMGIFIDIYPFDNFGNNEICSRKLIQKVKRINFLYTIYVNKLSVSSILNSMIRFPVHYILRAAYGKRYNEEVDNKIFRIIKENTDDSDLFIGQVTWEKGGVQFDREWFKERVLVPFEDRMYWIPKEYDSILRMSYGNYMELPPENMRVSSHDYRVYYKKIK